MATIGLRELRQDASELLRRVEAGEEIEITVAGRPSARLVGASSRQWRTFEQLGDLFDGVEDPDWMDDRNLIDQSLRDPWAGTGHRDTGDRDDLDVGESAPRSGGTQ